MEGQVVPCFSADVMSALFCDSSVLHLLATECHWRASLIGKAAVLKTAGFTPLGVRVPRPPPDIVAFARRGGRVAEGARLLSVCRETYRGFESLPLRQSTFK